jgi:hypothetical protein
MQQKACRAFILNNTGFWLWEMGQGTLLNQSFITHGAMKPHTFGYVIHVNKAQAFGISGQNAVSSHFFFLFFFCFMKFQSREVEIV